MPVLKGDLWFACRMPPLPDAAAAGVAPRVDPAAVAPCFAWTYLFQKLSTAFIRRFRSVVT